MVSWPSFELGTTRKRISVVVYSTATVGTRKEKDEAETRLVLSHFHVFIVVHLGLAYSYI